MVKMGRPKRYEKKRKWGVTWIYLSKRWFVNEKNDTTKCGILSGVSTSQLNDPKYLRRISAKKKYWDRYVNKR